MDATDKLTLLKEQLGLARAVCAIDELPLKTWKTFTVDELFDIHCVSKGKTNARMMSEKLILAACRSANRRNDFNYVWSLWSRLKKRYDLKNRIADILVRFPLTFDQLYGLFCHPKAYRHSYLGKAIALRMHGLAKTFQQHSTVAHIAAYSSDARILSIRRLPRLAKTFGEWSVIARSEDCYSPKVVLKAQRKLLELEMNYQPWVALYRQTSRIEKLHGLAAKRVIELAGDSQEAWQYVYDNTMSFDSLRRIAAGKLSKLPRPSRQKKSKKDSKENPAA